MGYPTSQEQRLIDIFCKAIDQREVFDIQYNNKWRIIELYAIGQHKDTKKFTLRAYYIDAPIDTKTFKHQYWRLFTISKIQTARSRTASFNVRHDYVQDDGYFSIVNCQI